MDSESKFYVDSKMQAKSSSTVTPKKKFGFFPKVGFKKNKIRSDGGGTFCLLFWNLHKNLDIESINLDSEQFGRDCNIG